MSESTAVSAVECEKSAVQRTSSVELENVLPVRFDDVAHVDGGDNLVFVHFEYPCSTEDVEAVIGYAVRRGYHLQRESVEGNSVAMVVLKDDRK